MRDWLEGKSFIVSEDHLKARWGCGKPGERFGCALCGYKFKLGDTARWQFTNDVPGAGGNPFVCRDCDTGKDMIVAKILEIRRNLERLWWFK